MSLADVKLTSKCLGERTDSSGWVHDLWSLTLGYGTPSRNYTFDFRTGIGHREKTSITRNWNGYVNRAPSVQSVLESLFSEATAEGESFPNWCANYGYDTDSRKALEIFLACQDIAVELRSVLGPDFDTIKQEIFA